MLPWNADSTTTWGTETIPEHGADLKRTAQFEAPISESSEMLAAAGGAHIKSAGAKAADSPSQSAPTSSYTPIRGVPALCHASVESCEAATNKCSGHGACVRRYEGCVACACKPSEGISWAGAACHKRDISAQFWLLAGFSALLVGLVAWSIGLLFSVGSETLPGVIGAGVAPKNR
jgi:hypothetical protein